ncbi:DUF4434 domain-containing protein [Francisellaceae bacterium]|nr:DUF4434 domain-containing protein [Francisellaceae bacterium]
MKKQIYLRFYLILIISLPFMLSSCVQEKLYQSKNNHNQIQAVFFQPWEHYLEENKYNWNDIFDHLAQSNIHQIVIQWTQYGNSNLLNDESHGNLFEGIVESAKQHHIKIVFGLYQDPDYFKKIQSPKTNTMAYFNQLRDKSISVAREIIELYGNENVIAGFYIPQEIDNVNWNTSDKTSALKIYLRMLNAEIDTISEFYPVYISGFYNLTTPIKEYALMWKQILEDVPIQVLMQNGVGAMSIPSSVCIDYFNIFNQYLPKGQWGIIAELFVPDTTNSNKFVCAAPKNIQQNIEEYKNRFKDIPIFLFSLTYLTQNNYQLLKSVSKQ